MSINLSKGQKVDLTKTNPTIKKYLVGLGWNPNMTDSGQSFDVDCSVFILGSNQKRLSDSHFVFYNNLKSPDEFVIHQGDNRTGEGEGDDEKVLVDFNKVTPDVDSIVFVVTIHDAENKRQNFGQISGSYIRILNAETNEELIRYDLNEDFSNETAITFGRIYKKDGDFKFDAIGTGFEGGLSKYLELY